MEMTPSFIAMIVSMIGTSCSFEFCRYRQETASFAIIISSVFADREVKLDGISFCNRDC